MCYWPYLLDRLSWRRECPAPTTAPAAALPVVAAPIAAPAAAPLALLAVPWVLFCCWAGGVCCWVWVVAGGPVGFAGCLCADVWGTTAGVTTNASTNAITFAERFIWPPLGPSV